MNLKLIAVISLLLVATTAHTSFRDNKWSTVTLNPKEDTVSPAAPDPVYQQIFKEVNQTNLQTLLKSMTGVIPVTVSGQTFSITDRYSSKSKANFRAYWTGYFASLGLQVQELAYATAHTSIEAQGHNLEAVLPGQSADSLVIIVHYDSMGKGNHETENPAVDDDMTGMATMLETARILVAHKAQLKHTVRFVAADYEEWASPGLEGAREYAQYIKNLSAKENFKIIGAIDNEQSGWNCAKDKMCGFSGGVGNSIDVFDCAGTLSQYNNPELGNAFNTLAATYSSMKTNHGCMSDHSDHYAMWEIGVPAIVFSEHAPFNNPHFDDEGGDTYDTIDQDYFFHIAQVGVTFAATLAGLE